MKEEEKFKNIDLMVTLRKSFDKSQNYTTVIARKLLGNIWRVQPRVCFATYKSLN